MSHHDPALVSVARAVGTIGLGLAAGLELSLPHLSLASLYAVPTLSPRDRLHFWSDHHKRAQYTLLPIVVSASAGLLYAAAFAATPAPYLPSTIISRHRRLVLLLAASLTLLQAPYTALTLLPKAVQLEKVEAEIKSGPAEDNARDTDSGVLEYKSLFWGRVALVVPAFVLAVAELVLA